VEGLARQLNADFNLLEEAKPMLRSDPEAVKAYVKATLSRRFRRKQ